VAHQSIGPGSVVASRFRLEDLLDEHSGARFWRATDLTLARNVAIHVLPADDPRAPALLDAARTSATVTDPHLLRVLDAVEEGDVVHVVHEWGSGVSLDRMLAEETLDPRRAAWLVREVAEAVTVAHRQGIAHGRLLPENVMVTDAGSVKLIGFVVDAVLHGRAQRPTDTLPAPSEHASDVLNLGALLYACLTGKWPGFPGSVLPDAPFDHERVYRPRQVRAGVPKRLDLLCDGILNDDVRSGAPAYDSAAAVAAALGSYLGGEPAAALADTSPTALLDVAPLREPGAGGSVPGHDARPDHADDPEATQAGAPPWSQDQLVDPADLEATRVSPVVGRTAPLEEPPPSGDEPEHRVPGTGMGAGMVPAHWGPASFEDTGSWSTQERASEAPGSSWLRLGVLVGVILLLVLAVVVALSLAGRDIVPGVIVGDDPAATPQADPTPVSAVVSDFDPDDQSGGTPSERPDQVPLATDGQADTAWTTENYFEGPPLAPYKSGVGLLLDLGEDVAVTDVVADLDGEGYTVQLLAAPEGTSSAPTSTEGLDVVATREGAGGRVVLAGSEPVTARYLVLWLTALPEGSDGYQGSVAEVTVRSRPAPRTAPRRPGPRPTTGLPTTGPCWQRTSTATRTRSGSCSRDIGTGSGRSRCAPAATRRRRPTRCRRR